jgi:tetratricopeptide (TPR) repeat protein
MSSKKNKKRNKAKTKAPKVAPKAAPIVDLGFWGNTRLHCIILFLFAGILYANTLGHNYTQDDAIVIYDNMYTTEGVAGIPGLLQKDTFFGFFKTEGKAKLVSGGRYRPFTPVMFAVGWEIFGKNPMIGHLFNLLWYALLGVLIYLTLKVILVHPQKTKTSVMLAFLAALIFVAHPVHTEVVANIKGRDEIMSLLGSIIATYLIFKKPLKGILNSVAIFVAFFLALMSKENAITFLGVVPLALYLFRKKSIGSIVTSMAPMLIATFAFLAIRTAVLGFDFGGTPQELMNNPYLKLVNGSYVDFSFAEKAATIIYTLGKYLMLLVFPLHLTHDYYPYHIPIMSFGDWQVWLSILAYAVIIFFAIYRFGKKSIPSFSIFYFLMTLSIVSNVVFPIGTHMSERFLFMPSVGFALLLAIMLIKYVHKRFGMVPFAVLSFLIVSLFSAKTIARNMVWKDDFTLFQTDVETSLNSAKVQNAAGGSLLTKSEGLTDPAAKAPLVDKAIGHLNKATQLHPTYRNAYLLLGNAYFYKSDYLQAIRNYERVLQLAPGNTEGINNLAVATRDYGRFFGEQNNDLTSSLKYLNQSYQLNPDDKETLRLLAVAYGRSGDHAKALPFFKRTTELAPEVASNWINLSIVYSRLGDEVNAQSARAKALQIDPNAFNQ